MRTYHVLDPELQRVVGEEADRLFPECTAKVPLCVALPAGIHPYNRGSAYFDDEGLAVVLYQDLGRLAMRSVRDPEVIAIIRHELCHWYQHRHLAYQQTSSNKVHRHRTWSRACFVASTRLWPDAGLEEWMFKPYSSVRVNGSVRSTQKKGALTDTELSHWPKSMSALLERLHPARRPPSPAILAEGGGVIAPDLETPVLVATRGLA